MIGLAMPKKSPDTVKLDKSIGLPYTEKGVADAQAIADQAAKAVEKSIGSVRDKGERGTATEG